MTERPGIISRRAFTIVELLIAVAVMITLLSLLTVALNSAMKQAQKTNTVVLMNSMKQGLVQFESDIGYFPPVLRRQTRDLQIPFDRSHASYANLMKGYYSFTTPAEYLLGYGDAIHDGVDGLGIRHPLEDGVWDATFRRQGNEGYGILSRRDPRGEGKIYGPYLQLSDDRMLAKISGDDLVYPGDPTFEDPTLPMVITDYWGEPIRYYRKPYASKSAIRQEIRSKKMHLMDEEALDPPSLADVPLLRPIEVDEGAVVDSQIPDASGDTTASRRLLSAQFALFSSGPDKALDEGVRYDEEDNDGDQITFENVDNIVEVGP